MTFPKPSPWLLFSLALSLIYIMLTIQPSFGYEYLVQDDARQHVFWMQQFRDPDLFPKDLIAQYFRSIVPAGYIALYEMAAQIGINPMGLSRWLPIGLGLATTGFCYGICVKILPIPVVGFVATFLLTQNLWTKDDLVSGTPRAFFYPLFTAFLFFLLQRPEKPFWKSLIPCLVVFLLQGLFYPQTLLLSCGVLVLNLIPWDKRQLPQRADWGFMAAGLGVAALVLLPFALQTSEYGPVITAAEARSLPEFAEHGRVRYFVPPLEYWLSWMRSGIFPSLWVPPLLLSGFLLPFLKRLPLLQQVRPNVKLLTDVIVASLVWFGLAHILLFRLQLPSRYTQHSFRVVFAVAAAIALAALFDGFSRWLNTAPSQRWKALGLTTVLAIALITISPTPTKSYPYLVYVVGRTPALYQFFQHQPKDIMIASLAQEVNNVPTFAQRSILTGREYALPYHKGYYKELRQRTVDLIAAQYTPDLAKLQAFIRQYGIDFWVVEQESFKTYYVKDDFWLRQYEPEVSGAIAQLESGQKSALAKLRKRCSVLQSDRSAVPGLKVNLREAGQVEVLNAGCLLEANWHSPPHRRMGILQSTSQLAKTGLHQSM
jgi:hypothetical protein